MYFIDANIFLELTLDQDKADDCEVFLKRVQNGGFKGGDYRLFNRQYNYSHGK